MPLILLQIPIPSAPDNVPGMLALVLAVLVAAERIYRWYADGASRRLEAEARQAEAEAAVKLREIADRGDLRDDEREMMRTLAAELQTALAERTKAMLAIQRLASVATRTIVLCDRLIAALERLGGDDRASSAIKEHKAELKSLQAELHDVLQ